MRRASTIWARCCWSSWIPPDWRTVVLRYVPLSKIAPSGKVVAVWRGVGRVQPAIAAVPFIVVRELDPPADKGMRPLLALALLTCTGAELRVGRFGQLFRRSSWNMAASPQNWRLKPEISLSGRDFLQTLGRDVPDPLVRNVCPVPSGSAPSRYVAPVRRRQSSRYSFKVTSALGWQQSASLPLLHSAMNRSPVLPSR